MAATPFSAGAALVPISPLPRHLESPLYLGGYGRYLERRACGVHDDLYARALILSDGIATAVIIALDLVGMSNQHIRSIRRAVATRLQVPAGAVLVSCTHTHAGPDLQGLWGGVTAAYAAHVRWQAVRSAVAAASNRQAVSLRVTTTTIRGRTVNRRGWPQTDGTMTTLQALDGSGQVAATLLNFAAHPTVTRPDNLLISRDFPGALVDATESSQGGVGLFINADQGDVEPAASGGFGEMTAYGEALAEEASRSLKGALELEPPLIVDSCAMDVALSNARLEPPPGFVLKAGLAAIRGLHSIGILRMLARHYAGRDRAFAFSGLGLIAEHPVRVHRGDLVLRTRLSRLRIGNGLDALCAPGEVLTRLGVSLRTRLVAPVTMFMGLTNDTLGYFVPRDEWMAGRNSNYEEAVSLGPDAGPALERAAGRLLGASTQQDSRPRGRASITQPSCTAPPGNGDHGLNGSSAFGFAAHGLSSW